MKAAALLLLCVLCASCGHVRAPEFITLDIVTVRVTPNALIMHMADGTVIADDLAEVKVETPGAWLNLTLPIAIPSPETSAYNSFVAAVPARKRMWDLLCAPARRLVIQVREADVKRYLEIKDDKSRVLPSVRVLELKSVEPR